MSFSRIIIQLLKTLTPLSGFSHTPIDMTSSSKVHDPRQLALNVRMVTTIILKPLPRKRKIRSCENQFTDQVLQGTTWANHGSSCLAIIEEIQRLTHHTNRHHYLSPTGDSTFTFILCFFQTHHPPYITQTPGWWPPQDVSPGIYWKNGLIPKKRGPQNVSRNWHHFGLPPTSLKLVYQKLAWGHWHLLTIFDFKKSLKNRCLRKKCWLELGTFGLSLLTFNSWNFLIEKKWKKKMLALKKGDIGLGLLTFLVEYFLVWKISKKKVWP